MIIEDINAAKDSVDVIREDIDRATGLYNDIYYLKEEEKKLKNTTALRRFGSHFFLILAIVGITRNILASLLLPLGFIGRSIYIITYFIGTILLIGIPILVAVKPKLSPYYIYKKNKIDEKLIPAQKEADSLSQKIEEHFRDDERLKIIPDKYMYPQAVDYFHEVITLGRANDLKEAMNLYEDYLHQWRMEENNEKMLKLQEATFAEAHSAKMASRTAAALSMAALMSRD